MDKRFVLTKDANPNYLASICRIGETFPIEGADKLVKTVVNGYDIVIGKDYKEGDIVVYFPVETAINEMYLSANNLFERSEFERNANADSVKEYLVELEKADEENDSEKAEEISAKIKSMCGFFNKNGRVRILKLRGQYSQGFIAGVDSLVKYDATLKDTDWESLVGTQFNYIDDKEFCHKYIPPISGHRSNNNVPQGQSIWKKRMKRLKKFDKLIDGQFEFHYDTRMLNEHMHIFTPDDNVVISSKRHGTSVIISNILCHRKLSNLEKIKKFFHINVQEKEYSLIYSSRSVIKNRYINPDKHDFYDGDPWGCVARDFGPYLDKGMSVYGEIVGYVEGSTSMIQKGYDYGCKLGQWKFMPYRITMTDELGNKTEYDVSDVDKWTRNLVSAHPELKEKTLFMDIRYHGTFKDLYPDISTENHWHENVLAAMKSDTTNFCMEQNDPICRNKVPYEGVVIRIDGDKISRAFKLKCQAFYNKEAKQHDEGTSDIEENS